MYYGLVSVILACMPTLIHQRHHDLHIHHCMPYDPHSGNLVCHQCDLTHQLVEEAKELPGVVEELQDNGDLHVVMMLPGVVEVIQDTTRGHSYGRG